MYLDPWVWYNYVGPLISTSCATYIDVLSLPTGISIPFSISMWVNIDKYGVNNGNTVGTTICTYGRGPNIFNYEFMFGISPSGNLCY